MMNDVTNNVLQPTENGRGREGSPEISIIIPSYNTRALLERCLSSLETHAPVRPFEILVVDDASVDETVEMVRTRFPWVKLIVNERNRGYARSNNHAFEQSRGRFVYLLNSDTEVLSGAVDTLAEFLSTHEEAGTAGSLLYNGDGSVQACVKALPSVRSAIFGNRSFLATWFPSNRWVKSELRHLEAERQEPFRAGYISMASMMIRRDVLRRAGPLDTRFFYFIDADYCKRIWDLGLAVYCVPAAKVIHAEHQGGTMAGWKKRFRSTVTFHYGAYIYHRKHSGKPRWHPFTLLMILGLGARFLVSVSVQALKELTGMAPQDYGRGRASGRGGN